MVSPVDGTPFGRYLLIELLGRGGMGEVWRARDTAANNRTVAIKLLPPHLAADHTFVQRFRREADAAAQLNNPHIVPIHNYGEIDGRLYVDMRLIEGRDLQAVLGDGPLEPARAVRIVEQVAKALHTAHKVGLVHRDVKPSNILLDEDDFAYLIDFGIARGADQTRMTGTSGVIGSWPYLSPERLRAGQVDARADVYALACVLYECLTGSTPFPGDNTEQLITAHFMEPPPRPSITDPNVPVALDAVIATGMAKDPDQRYATTVELASAAHDAVTAPISLPTQNLRTPAAFVTSPAPPMPATQPAAQPQPADPNLVATQQGPADLAPPDTSAPSPSWWGRQRRQVQLGLIAATVVILAAGVGITGYILREPSTTSKAATTAQISTTTQPPTTTPTAPPVAEAALDGLLLSPDQINTAMGSTGMTVSHTRSVMDDDSARVPDQACRPLDGPLIAPVYAGSGWSAFREQVLSEPGTWTHRVDQGVVLFSSAHDAAAFFTASAQQWPACTPAQLKMGLGPVSNTNGTLSATQTYPGGGKANLLVTCQRALTVANNVAIDVDTCSTNLSDSQSGAGVNIVRQIAAKVPT